MTKEEERKQERKREWIANIGKAKKSKMEGLLAIDPATNCGWACSDGTYGVWVVSKKQHESQGMKWIKFRKILYDFITKNNIKVVAYEVAAGRHINAIKHHAVLVGIIEEECESLGIESVGYNIKEIKQFLTNNGNAGKELMIEHASKFFGYSGSNDNEADAIAILNMLRANLS